MQDSAIFAPFVGMLVLTFAVWALMYTRRLIFMKTNKVDPQRLTTPEKAAKIIPEKISYPAQNLRNLFELPVVFYALCLYLFVAGKVDAVYVVSAWVFLGLRVVHSFIHCTANIVMLRFLAYFVSALVVWFMVLRAALDVFS